MNLLVETAEVLLASHPEQQLLGPVALGDREEMPVVALADGIAVVGCREALGGVGADRLEHLQPGGRVRLPPAHEQALSDEVVERVEVGAGDRLGRLDRRAAREHGEAREARLLAVAQQLVAPVDGRAQRVVAGGRVASGGAGSAECHVQTFGDLGGRQQPAAGRGELDRQRQPVDAPADLRDRGSVAVAQIKRGIVGTRPLDEQRDRIVAGRCPRVLGRSEFGK